MPEPSSAFSLPVPSLRSSARAASAEATGRRLGQLALGGVVLAYLGSVLLAPLGAMAVELVKLGPLTALSSLLEPNALLALRMTLILTALSVAINAVFGTLGAVAIVRHRFALRPVINALSDLPLAVSPVMVGLAFILLFGREGLLAPLTEAAGIKVVFAFTGLLLGTLFVSLPYTIREVAYVLDELGTSEEEAAATLGASPWQIFLRVTLPNVRFGLAYGLLMTLARSVGEFGAVLVLGGSISGQTQTATTFIHDSIDQRATASAYGMALLLALISVVLLLGLEWFKRRKHGRTR
ncbi:MAG TPA: ABC transporter permease subunit [Polyangiales bacterium]|nr:ABC transporter permease subunit [Polyangiales bacterium]